MLPEPTAAVRQGEGANSLGAGAGQIPPLRFGLYVILPVSIQPLPSLAYLGHNLGST